MKLVNEFGAINHETEVGQAVDYAKDVIRANILQIINDHKLDALDIIMLSHHLAGEVDVTCSAEALRYGVRTRINRAISNKPE